MKNTHKTIARLHRLFNLLFLLITTCPVFAYNSSGLDSLKTQAVKNDTLLAREYVEKAELQYGGSQYDTSIINYKKAAAIYKKHKVWDKYIQSMHGMVKSNIGMFKPDTALIYCEKAGDVAKQYLSEDHLEMGNNYFYFGECEYEKVNFDKALEYYDKALKIYIKKLGKDHPKVSGIYHNSGICYLYQGRYDMALEYSNKANKINIKLMGENHPDVAASYYIIGHCNSLKGQYDLALEYFHKALNIYIKTLGEDHPDVSSAYHAIGNCSYYKGSYDKALEYYDKALNNDIKALGETHPDIALSYYGFGQCYSKKGNYDLALEYYFKALDIYVKTLDENHSEIANAYNAIGDCQADKGNYDLALEYYFKSLKIDVKTVGETHPNVATSYNNIGNCHFYKGRYDTGIEYFLKAVNIYIKTLGEDHPEVANSYNAIGHYHFYKGNYNTSIEYYNKALNIAIKTSGENHHSVASYCLSIGNSLYRKNDCDKAMEYFFRALNIAIKSFDENHPEVAKSYNATGNCLYSKGNYDSALKYFYKALNIDIKTVGEDHPNVANSYHNIGKCHYGGGNYDLASEYFFKALDINIKTFGENHPDIADSYHQLGNCFYDKGNYDMALTQYQKALTALCSGFEDANITGNPSLEHINSKVHLLDALRAKANTLSQRYDNTNNSDDLELSFETVQLATSLIDSMRFEISSRESVQELLDNSMDVYDQAIQSAILLHEKTQNKAFLHQAFTIAEKSKAFLLLQGIKDAQARQFANIPDSLITIENELKIDIDYYRKKLFELELKSVVELTKSDSTDIAFYQDKLFEKKRTLETLIAKFEKEHSQYYKLKYDFNVASVAEIQKKIRNNDKAFVEYFVGDSSIYIFNITKDDFHVKSIQKPKELEKWVDDLRKSLLDENYKDNQTTEAYTLYTQTAWKLYNLLLAEVITDYDNPPSQFVIVPDGPLYYIPFEVLLSQAISPADHIDSIAYNTLPYLVRQHQFSYSYSATMTLENAGKERGTTNGKCLAFAPAYDDTNLIASAGTLHNLRSNTLSALPGTIQEIGHIASHLNGDFYTGTEASEAQFKQKAGEYGIIHLAMHGLADDNSPLYSKLFFHTSQDSLEDDTLYAYELYNMTLPVELVVLSACETGTGQFAGGEGVMSMARAFMYAGSPSVAQTMWKVDDQASAVLMSFFYEYLSEGMDKSEALQKSKLRYLETADAFSGDPFFWAGFVLNGDTAALATLQNQKNLFLWLLIPIALLFLYFLSKKMKKKN